MLQLKAAGNIFADRIAHFAAALRIAEEPIHFGT